MIHSVNVLKDIFYEKGCALWNKSNDGDATKRRRLYDDNINWIGIYNPLVQSIAIAIPTLHNDESTTGRATILVLGAGGTAHFTFGSLRGTNN